MFVPHGTFSTSVPIVLHGGPALPTKLVGGGKHVATITPLLLRYPLDVPLISTPVPPVTRGSAWPQDTGIGAGALVSDIVVAAPSTTPLLRFSAPHLLLRDVRTAATQDVSQAEAAYSKVSFEGAASGHAYGLSLDHFDGGGYSPGLDTTRFTLITVNNTGHSGGELHLYGLLKV